MNYRLLTSEEFQKNAKKLIKKYRSLKLDLSTLIKSLEENPQQGVKIGENIFKIRLAVKSKGKGKSGGLRVITYLYVAVKQAEKQDTIVLLTIYDKSDFANVSDQYLRGIIASVEAER